MFHVNFVFLVFTAGLPVRDDNKIADFPSVAGNNRSIHHIIPESGLEFVVLKAIESDHARMVVNVCTI